jgi:2-amino-4-hydroxy-6-hydroxymethyldihydropteridine diphosphokinase
MTITYLSCGANQGDRRANLEYALEALKAGGVILKASSIYETEPVGFRDQPWFLNLAIEMETRLTPHELLDLCQNIENSRARVRAFTNAPRTLDIDILLYGNITMNEPRLTIPHPRMTERKFVLQPLAQIAPAFLHPLLKQSVLSLLESCTDASAVAKIVNIHINST